MNTTDTEAGWQNTAEGLNRQNKIMLSEHDWECFLGLLEADDEPTEAAKKATMRYNKRYVEGVSDVG